MSSCISNSQSQIEQFKSILDMAIEAGDWEKANSARVAIKRMSIECIACGTEEVLTQIQKALSDSWTRLRLSLSKEVISDPTHSAWRIHQKLLADAETCGIAIEMGLLPGSEVERIKEKVIGFLSAVPEKISTSTDITKAVGAPSKSVSIVLGKLRAEGKIVSRRKGQFVIHRFMEC
ncbi:hypothetical protein AA11825_2637 [Acetobacter pomorum DSM 11825]|nr:hypothetical protein [Acetobacter pomorum]GBR54257.1 hypothetical protein AA11825_2637 [Acetobacter pomorum DSM 11825]